MASKITKEDIVLATPEMIYNFIRFDVLKTSSDEEKKKLFMKLFNVSIQNEKIIQSFVDALNAGDYKSLDSFADKHAIDFKKEIQKIVNSTVGNSEFKVEKTNVVLKDPAIILDAYFQHSDPKSALNVLKSLVSLTVYSNEEFSNFMKYFNSLSKEKQSAEQFGFL